MPIWITSVPDDGGHSAFKRIEERNGDDDKDGSRTAGVENDGDNNGNCEDTDPFREGAGDQKNGRSHFSHLRPEAALHQFIGGEQLAFEVLREKYR